jgi:hypothetical protein
MYSFILNCIVEGRIKEDQIHAHLNHAIEKGWISTTEKEKLISEISR